MQHPSQILSEEDIQLIRSNSLAAEAQGALTAAQLQLIYDKKWFKVMVPVYAGGLELSLPETMRLMEAAAWADGSFGWVLNLGAGANLFAGFLPRETAKELFFQREICIAGSGAQSGTAEKTDGGYLINGTWKYASGTSHATFFSVTCLLTQGGVPGIDDKGGLLTRSFIIPKERVTITKRWNSYGLKATASHDFKIEGAVVPDDYSFSLAAPSVVAEGPLYKFPFLQLAEALLAVTMSGMACHFIGLIAVLLKAKLAADPDRKKDYPLAEKAIGDANTVLMNARMDLYRSVESTWLRYERKQTVPEKELYQITIAARQCADVSRMSVESLYPWAGMDAIIPETDLNRVWRDIHTASQHILLSPFSIRT